MWGIKHLSTWTIYNACKTYGWPKVYRRLLEQNRIINSSRNKQLQMATKNTIRLAIEAPPKFAAQLSQHAETILPFLQKIVEQAEPNMPRFLVAIARYIINSQKPIKIMQDFIGAAKTQKQNTKVTSSAKWVHTKFEEQK